jgi:parallel beta-helix repeat protein
VDVDNVSGSEDGTSWATAFTTIQPAIDAADVKGGGEVWVAQGNYSENRSYMLPGPAPVATGSLELKDAVALYGGFIGIEDSLDERDWQQNSTVIDGATALNGQAAKFVVVAYLNGVNSRLDGFTVSGGNNPSGGGGGLFARELPLNVVNCTFENNTVAESGGGVHLIDSDSIIEDCTFRNNHANRTGGGIRSTSGSQATIVGCTFENNSADQSGGAIWTSFSDKSTITECTFRDNESDAAGAIWLGGSQNVVDRCWFEINQAIGTDPGQGIGGAMWVGDPGNQVNRPEIRNSVFWKNTAAVHGGGLFVSGSTDPLGNIPPWRTRLTMANCTFYANIAAVSGGGIYLNNAMRDWRNLIMWNNSPEGYFWEFDQGGTAVNSLLDQTVNPLFVDASDGDFHLLPGSPAIDTGTDEGAPDVDFEGTARPQGASTDMGAYESMDLDGDGLSDEEEADLGTDPNVPDSDGDGYWDGFEVDKGTNPLEETDTPATNIEGDVNADGKVNIQDIQAIVIAVLQLPVPHPTDITGDARTNIVDVQRAVELVLAG